MSKSLGNGIDPLLLIDRYGADAVRFALVREVAGAGQDIRLDYDRKKKTSQTVEASRNFANKLWNATRFALINIGQVNIEDSKIINKSKLQLSDRWILSRLARINQETSDRFKSYGLGEAAKGLYEFAWNDFCDWYLELIKRRLNPGANPTKAQLDDQQIAREVLSKVLRELLIMLHPLMPHLTEELWHALLGNSYEELLALQKWPKLEITQLDNELEQSFSELFSAIRVVRNLRAEAGLKPSQEVPVRFVSSRLDLCETLHKSEADIRILTRANKVDILSLEEAEGIAEVKALAGVSGELEVVLPIEGLVDVDALRARLEKDLRKANDEINSLTGRLSNSSFTSKAPKEIVVECQQRLSEAEAQSDIVRSRLSRLD